MVLEIDEHPCLAISLFLTSTWLDEANHGRGEGIWSKSRVGLLGNPNRCWFGWGGCRSEVL
jgi:hypothetical protein